MPKIFDNIENKLIEGLNNTLEVSYRSDFCVGYFNLRGWGQVADQIDSFQSGEGHCCRLLVGMQKSPSDILREHYSKNEELQIDNNTASKNRKKLAQEFKDQLTIGIPTEKDELGLRKLSRQIKDKKVVVKLFMDYPLHAKLYLLFRDDVIAPIIGYIGSSNLTLAGLSRQGELNVDVLEQDAAVKLTKWFEDRWNARFCIDISDELVEIIDNSWAADRLIAPYHIYLKIAYHLSREARTGLTEFKIPILLQDKLHNFQQKAVSIAAHYLYKRNGVLIGDVVGLGKTLTATAIAKIFEEDFYFETLIICPKNLVDMWEGYAHNYQLRAKVLSITEVQSKLQNFRRFRLIIIDESHNLRNREGRRYRAIHEYIKDNESKVILLSATPYNKTYLDLSSQLRLFIDEESDLGVSPEKYIAQIGGKVQFMAKHQCSITTLPAFEKSEHADDWRQLMRLYMVRRPRSFIKQNYAGTDPQSGRKYLQFADGKRSYFSDRIPLKVEYPFDPKDKNDQYARLYSEYVVLIINNLKLPRYGLGNYLNDKTTLKVEKDEQRIQDNLSRAGRRLMGFCRTNLFKRLESSGYSFFLSLARHVLRNFIHVYALDKGLAIPIGQNEVNLLDEYLSDADIEGLPDAGSIKIPTDENEYYAQAEKVYKLMSSDEKKFDWIRCGFFSKDLKSDLIHDCREIIKIIMLIREWVPTQDRQLNALYDLCAKKHASEKLLIFTQFADTARYLSSELRSRGVTALECVTGGSGNPTEFAHRFSPESNEKKEIIGSPIEIRVLITTDVLSEGQNLQDAHIIVNYDLPWAIIRLIQRAGRVDRIGQKSKKILCYSFLPEDGIEHIIHLRGKLKQRITDNAEVVGADEVFFEGDPVIIHDFYNERHGMLDDDEDTEVDLASYAYQIWKNATDADPSLKKTIPDMPNVVYGTKVLSRAESDKKSAAHHKEGVVVYMRTADDNDVMAWVDKDGGIVTQSQLAILKAAECQANTPALAKIESHHKLVEQGVDHIKKVEKDIGGQLGKKSGARYRAYMRLSRYYEEYKGTLFVNEPIKRSIDDMYKYPLREFAKDTINRQLKTGISDEDLADLVVSLREDDKLCNSAEDEHTNKEPQIICSMGLRAEGIICP
ncbi:helicase-related protein [Candidatus Magnetominusculus xianensis]|uniref:helicase-related protein n=1 Tax=Candidatus Magnetominusculus xianensis TaxID=1748249 RepID=UPI000A103F71|nr:helicase-related protein [Candidatus Magnetominusculus xianensis]MBF0404657.1 DEAD/DEAH box helicase family protein [Nitrospirota bacterium]